MIQIKIFNSEKTEDVEEGFKEFVNSSNIKVIDVKYSTAGKGGYNRDAVCVLYEED